MSGTPRLKPPRNNAEWARNTEKRQGATEHPLSQRVGQWVLSEQANTGNLIASHVNGGSTILAAPPEPSDEAGADEVSSEISILSLTKTSLQAVGTTATVVQWDDVRADLGGWTSGVISGGLTEVTVPTGGIYSLTSTVHFQVGGSLLASAIRVNGSTVIGTTVIEPNSGSWPSVVNTGIIPLLSGDVLQLVAVRGAGSSNIGGSAVGNPPLPCMFTVHRIATG